MKVFTSNDFKGFWSVGTAAVVVADNEDQAKQMLKKSLANIGLKQDDDGFTVVEVKTEYPLVVILNDGNY